jgi:hypothetical protein
MNDPDLFRDAIKAFIAARDAGCPLHDCVRAVLDVAESQSDSLSGAGMEILSLVETKPGEPKPEIGLKIPDDQTWTLETVALTSGIFVAAHPSGNGFVAAHARGHHQWLRHSDCDCALEVVDITAEVGPPMKHAVD